MSSLILQPAVQIAEKTLKSARDMSLKPVTVTVPVRKVEGGAIPGAVGAGSDTGDNEEAAIIAASQSTGLTSDPGDA